MPDSPKPPGSQTNPRLHNQRRAALGLGRVIQQLLAWPLQRAMSARHRNPHTPDLQKPLMDVQELAEIAALASASPTGSRISEHLQRGEQLSRFRGAGIDFEDLRPYQPGDDPRRIDWRVSARLRKTFVRVYGETRQSVTWVVLDRGASMRFGTRTRLKAAQAARLGALILSSAARSHHALGYSLLDGEHHRSQTPRSGRAMLHAALEAMRAPCPPPHGSQASDWAGLLGELEIHLPPGSRLWLLSDFLGLSTADERLLERLAARSELHLGLIEDPQEARLPQLGRIRLMGNGEPLDIDTRDFALRQAYQTMRTQRLTHLQQLAQRLGNPLLHADSEADVLQLAHLLAHLLAEHA